MKSHQKGLFWIGLYVTIKGVFVLLIGIGILHFLHRDIEAFLWDLVLDLHVDPENRMVHKLLISSANVTTKQVALLSIGAFVYAALHFLEGIGLMMRKRWGEWMTVVVTGALVPVEIYEVFRHFTWVKLGATALNIACVWYVSRDIRETWRSKKTTLNG